MDKRSLLSNELLDDLLMLNTDKVPLSRLNADNAIQLWWKDKTRQPNQTKRKKYKKHCCKEKVKKDKVILLDSDSDSEVDTTQLSDTSRSSSRC